MTEDTSTCIFPFTEVFNAEGAEFVVQPEVEVDMGRALIFKEKVLESELCGNSLYVELRLAREG